jgi:hypoxanthine phosphoribosyltransferase
MLEIQILDKKFREFIPEQSIQEVIEQMAEKMNLDLAGKDVVFLGILNGSFIFTADIFRRIDLVSQVTFLKLTSYKGTGTSGCVKELIGWNEDVKNKTVVVFEDIVDTGNTLERIIDELKVRKVNEIKIATLLFKPGSYKKKFKIDYIGFEIPNDFVIGFGLDYNGFGRNLPSIYKLIS